MLANRIAEERGYDEALFISRDDMVLEGPTFAFFWVEDGAMHAPPLAEGILDSITRRRVLDAVDVIGRALPARAAARARRGGVRGGHRHRGRARSSPSRASGSGTSRAR